MELRNKRKWFVAIRPADFGEVLDIFNEMIKIQRHLCYRPLDQLEFCERPAQTMFAETGVINIV